MRDAGERALSLLSAAALLSAFGTFALVYGSAVGLGFLSDDFGWIRTSQVHSLTDFGKLFLSNNGFYRPMVSLTFSADFGLFGLRPLGYGVTNLGIAVACAFLLFRLAKRLGLGSTSWLAPAIWLLNFHGINMALLWISGRTSLLVTLFALAAALALMHGRMLLCLLALVSALLSKEEATMLPVVLIIWSVVGTTADMRRSRGRLGILIIGSGCALAIYAFARHYSGAMTPETAPSYYRFTLNPAAVIRNAAEYCDRSCTFPAVVGLLAWAILRERPPLIARRLTILGLSWLFCFFALTVFLPVRSSLYACLPSVGSALIATAFVGAVWARLDSRRKRHGLLVAIIVPILLSPIYVLRNKRWTDLARYSTSVLEGLSRDLERAPSQSWVVLIDKDRASRVNIQSAFGTLIGDAVSLRANKPLSVWVEPPLSMAPLAGMRPPCAECPVLQRTVLNGRIER